MTDPNPDRFIRAHYAALERRESPRCVSMEARSAGGYEAAQHAESAFAFSLLVMGTLERDGRLTALDLRILRAAYLRLHVDHVAIVTMHRPGEREEVRAVHDLAPGQAVPECAEVQSQINWSEVGRAEGVSRRHALAIWNAARATVRDELEERARRVDPRAEGWQTPEGFVEDITRRVRGGRAPGARR